MKKCCIVNNGIHLVPTSLYQMKICGMFLDWYRNSICLDTSNQCSFDINTIKLDTSIILYLYPKNIYEYQLLQVLLAILNDYNVYYYNKVTNTWSDVKSKKIYLNIPYKVDNSYIPYLVDDCWQWDNNLWKKIKYDYIAMDKNQDVYGYTEIPYVIAHVLKTNFNLNEFTPIGGEWELLSDKYDFTPFIEKAKAEDNESFQFDWTHSLIRRPYGVYPR